eukprot:45453-Eustigmatos_ZCMA.PRE.1
MPRVDRKTFDRLMWSLYDRQKLGKGKGGRQQTHRNDRLRSLGLGCLIGEGGAQGTEDETGEGQEAE